MWYSMIGTILTVVLGLLASIITQWISEMRIKNISGQIPKNHSGIFRSNAAQSIPERKISTLTTMKIESTIRKEMSSGPQYNSSKSNEDKLNFLSQASICSSNDERPISTNNAAIIQMFDDGILFEARYGVDNLAADIRDDIENLKK